jgi:hypothetical protein
VQYCKSVRAGDDAIAFIAADPTSSSDVKAMDNYTADNTGGRGVAFEGTATGKAYRNRSYRQGSGSFGVLNTPANQFDGATNSNIEIRWNVSHETGTRTAQSDAAIRAPIFAYALNNPSTSITISENWIYDPPNYPYGIQLFGTDAVNALTATVQNNVMINTTGAMVQGFIGSSVWSGGPSYSAFSATNCTVSAANNTLNGTAVSPGSTP